MKQLKLGSAILSFWFVLNILPAVIALAMIMMGKHAPALQYLFDSNETAALDVRILQTIDGLAIIANSLIITYCLMAFFLVRRCLLHREKWAFWVIALCITIIQIASYWSDHQFMSKNVWIVHFSSAVFLLGLLLSYLGLSRKK